MEVLRANVRLQRIGAGDPLTFRRIGEAVLYLLWRIHVTGQDLHQCVSSGISVINVSTRKFRRAVRLPEGDVPAPTGAGVSKSAASRHFVALSAARMKEWMGADLSGLDIMVVQIDGIHISEHLVLVAALGIDSEGLKHPLGLMEGATEHSAVVQALIDDLIERGLDPAVPRLFIIDGSKALSKAIRRSFGCHTPIQRCQIHKARNIMERLSPASACLGPINADKGFSLRGFGPGGDGGSAPGEKTPTT